MSPSAPPPVTISPERAAAAIADSTGSTSPAGSGGSRWRCAIHGPRLRLGLLGILLAAGCADPEPQTLPCQASGLIREVGLLEIDARSWRSDRMSAVWCSGRREPDATVYEAGLGNMYVTLRMKTTLGGSTKGIPTTVEIGDRPYDTFAASGECLADLERFEGVDSDAGYNVVGSVTCKAALSAPILGSISVESLSFQGISP